MYTGINFPIVVRVVRDPILQSLQRSGPLAVLFTVTTTHPVHSPVGLTPIVHRKKPVVNTKAEISVWSRKR